MSTTMNVVIVDDEQSCIDNLRYYLDAWCPAVRITATADDAAGAIDLLAHTDATFAFLDVELFEHNIFYVLDALQQRPFHIIFVTAHPQYALPALRASAFDYLLKPLEREEILRCYHRMLAVQEQLPAATPPPPAAKPVRKVRLKQGDVYYPVELSDIISLTASGFYTVVRFEYRSAYKEIKLAKPLQAVCDEWQYDRLVRVHRSYTVNMEKIAQLRRSNNQLSLLMADKQCIPVAKRKAAEFLALYGK